MGDDYWQATAQCFEQLFSKPKMTEKLLQRPPFRYVHDIYTATLGATGFGEGLYSGDELDAKAIKDKDQKINFLEKLIALVQMAAGEEIPIKSSKIVAGQEPEATNIFLQYLFKVATSGIDSGPIVAEIVGGGGEDEGQQQEDDEDDAAQRQAEEEEERKRQKRAAKKAQMEEEAEQEKKKQMKAKKEAEEKEKEKAKAKAKEEVVKKAKKPAKRQEEPEEQIQEPAIIEDGQDDDEDPQNFIHDENEEIGGGIDINDVDPESKFGKKAMAQLRAQEEEEANQNIDDGAAGGGIKMGKIGRRGKKKVGGVERSEPQKKVLVNEAPKRTFGGYNEDDIDHMRKSIQALCQATNPLGKSIDFVTEDIDSMVKEYDHWKLDYAESQSKLVEQQRITEQTIQPLQDVTLAQLEERIREEKAKIQNIRSQIIRNDNTVQNLLQSVISSG